MRLMRFDPGLVGVHGRRRIGDRGVFPRRRGWRANWATIVKARRGGLNHEREKEADRTVARRAASSWANLVGVSSRALSIG